MMNRRYESYTNRASPVSAIRAFTVSGFRPRFRTVSIMPGIENLEPDRTETSRGFSVPPNVRPMVCSTSLIAVCMASVNPAGSLRPFW